MGQSKRRGMSLHDRLKKAREAAGYTEATKAAEAFGWNANTYRSNENGMRTFSREAAIRYSRAFRVSLEWLLTGRGPMKATRRGTQVIGTVGAGAAVFPLDTGGFDEVTAPFDVPDDAVAFQVRGNSMYPAYREHAYVIARPLTDVSDALYARAVVTLEDGSRYLKEVLPGSSPGLFTLVSFAPGVAPIADVRITAAARVIGSVEP